ncbi:Glycosyltransferase involved in cell wall bisynthesis [Actinopolyspora xinjiangensis]|uniref:Glycosyltransferase involved in cell wall bisynthesis n=1 Tax=Actinopolyspora xinjiangensis TaxID=405564 RepID=A0A1H0WUQ1_9ACTN|nr:glycosyltransferase family 4 protein [Actinopolyspora xinjiangensis]SDP94412.1 Glycosyltransferase involved in cell wall bisynthesis [Actinopolyspora xinjiangensis]
MSASPRVATVITRLEGGAGVVVLRCAVALREDSCSVTLVTGAHGPLVRRAQRAGVEVVVEPALRKPITPWWDLLALFRLVVLFSRGGFDVVHTHTAKAGALGRMAARLSAVPRVVHTYHGFPFHRFQRWGKRRCYVAVERLLGRVTDNVLCVGDGVAGEAVRRRLASPNRIRAVGVPVPLDAPLADTGNRRRARRELGVDEDCLLVGAVGRLTYQKAPEDLVDALARLPRRDFRGVWIGTGEREREVERLARDRLGDRFVLAGQRSDVIELLPALDVFVLPSRYEGLPLAVIEAMLCGLPVVATAVNAVPDLVATGRTGVLVPPRRPDLLAEAVAALLDDPAKRTRMGRAGHRRVERDRFGIDAVLGELRSVYLGE